MIKHDVLLARAASQHTLGSLGDLATEWIDGLCPGDVYSGPELAAEHEYGFAKGTAEYTVFVHIARSILRNSVTLSVERGSGRILAIADKPENDGSAAYWRNSDASRGLAA